MDLAVRRRIVSGHDPVALTLRPLRNLQHPLTSNTQLPKLRVASPHHLEVDHCQHCQAVLSCAETRPRPRTPVKSICTRCLSLLDFLTFPLPTSSVLG
ncbi:hypothetical protein VTJ04DRAFT_4712 [Mycothermus thermophilus]|uniref:uncharacterized protein n=1 Tax=Humicola insolens TaxID=85995 RepID=UPI003742DCB2